MDLAVVFVDDVWAIVVDVGAVTVFRGGFADAGRTVTETFFIAVFYLGLVGVRKGLLMEFRYVASRVYGDFFVDQPWGGV